MKISVHVTGGFCTCKPVKAGRITVRCPTCNKTCGTDREYHMNYEMELEHN